MTNGNGNGGIHKPITETVKALAGTPMLLVLAVINVAVLGMLTYLLVQRSAMLQKERSELLGALTDCMGRLNHDGP